MPDSLDLALNREVILLAGTPSTGKSYATAMLCVEGLERGFEVVVIDRDRGLAKAIKEVHGKVPENLTYFLGNAWSKYKEGVDYAMEHLVPKDWLVFEMLGGMWDGAQAEFVTRVYKGGLAEHLLLLRADAEEEVRKAKGANADKTRAGAMSYGGFNGRVDWPTIKRIHNDEIRDRAIWEGDFNILGTTSVSPLQEGARNTCPELEPLGIKPNGEPGNIHKFDTLALSYKQGGKFLWRTDMGNHQGKDRGGRELVRDVDMSEVGFVTSYFGHHGLEL